VSDGLEIWFGMHKGTQVTDLPTNYLRWIAEHLEPTVEPKHVGRNAPPGFAINLYRRRRELIDVAADELAEREEVEGLR